MSMGSLFSRKKDVRARSESVARTADLIAADHFKSRNHTGSTVADPEEVCYTTSHLFLPYLTLPYKVYLTLNISILYLAYQTFSELSHILSFNLVTYAIFNQ